jgi:hypothetical protein
LHKHSLALIALTVGLFSASQAKASTLDTFVLTGDGNTFSFSLMSPSSASHTGFLCPGFSGVCYSGVAVVDNGHSQTDTIEFTADDGLEIFNSHGNEIVDLSLDHHQPDFYSSTTHNYLTTVSFIGGTYLLGGDDNGYGNYDWDSRYDCDHDAGYTLVIDPPAAVPEPSSLAFMSTGLLAAAGAVRRRMKK